MGLYNSHFHPGVRAGIGVIFLAYALFIVAPAQAQPVIVESDWSLLRSIAFNNPISACYNPVDGYIYVGQRGSTDGLFRIDQFGFVVQVSGGSNTAAVSVDVNSGSVFQSEDYGGVIYRTAIGATGRETWVSGFHSGDDDPVGMAFAPLNYTGDVLSPGEGLVVDRGSGGLDEIWIWSPDVAQGEVLLHVDDGTLVDAVDVAIDETSVFILDVGGGNSGVIYELGVGGTLTPLATSEPLVYPGGITIDPWNGDLLVLDTGSDRVVRVDRANGQVTDVITGMATDQSWAGIDIYPDGRGLLVTNRTSGVIYEYGRCGDSGPGLTDCDANGIHDICDIAFGTHLDCNGNDIPDECDFADGTSDDCNFDGIPDECPHCPTVELVFIMDTSSSMDNEAAALCGSMNAVVAKLQAQGIDVEPRLLGICNTPGGAYGCLEDHVLNLLGSAVPGSPPAGLETLANCPGGIEVCSEDWGLATAVVAGLYPWQPAGESVRLVIPLFDEGAWCGDPVTAMDEGAVTHAIAMALGNEVIVSPITGGGSSGSVVAEAQSIADATGGQYFSSSIPDDDIAQGVVELVLAACTSASDCNDNGVLDDCDIASGNSLDANLNTIPDECEFVSAVPTIPGGAVLSVTNWPNPFNPRTVIGFEVGVTGPVHLAVYDLAGALVRTLLSDEIRETEIVHEAVWNGVDEAGKRVPTGVYFYRLKAGGASAVGRMTLLK